MKILYKTYREIILIAVLMLLLYIREFDFSDVNVWIVILFSAAVSLWLYFLLEYKITNLYLIYLITFIFLISADYTGLNTVYLVLIVQTVILLCLKIKTIIIEKHNILNSSSEE